MKRYGEAIDKRKRIYIGIDLHRIQWHVTIWTEEADLFNGSIPRKWEALRRLLDRYQGYEKQAVYEAGYFGFWPSDFDRQIATNSVERSLSSSMII